MENRHKSIETALAITAGFLFLYLWTGSIRLLHIAAAVALTGLFWPRAAALLHVGWMRLAKALGWVNSRVLLSILFFVFFTPVAWWVRLTGRSAIVLRRKKTGES